MIKVELADDRDFWSRLLQSVDPDTHEEDADRALERIDVCFQITYDGSVVEYIEDFAFFFGYQMSAFFQLLNESRSEKIRSFSGCAMCFTERGITIHSKSNDTLTLTRSRFPEYVQALRRLLGAVSVRLKSHSIRQSVLKELEARFEALEEQL